MAKRRNAAPGSALPDFSALGLGPKQFHLFYRSAITLRFPLKVSEVLELRYLINHAAEGFEPPAHTIDYRHFRERMLALMDRLGIERSNHRERLLTILAMLRERHYAHSVASRDEEARVRAAMAQNRAARTRSQRYGQAFLALTAAAAVWWYAQTEPGWFVRLLAVAAAFLAWDSYHALPLLDRNYQRLTQQLNELLRCRISNVNWRILVDRLSLVLGLRRPRGLSIFVPDEDAAYPLGPTFH